MIVTKYGDEIRRKFGTISKVPKSLKLVQNTPPTFQHLPNLRRRVVFCDSCEEFSLHGLRQFVLATWLTGRVKVGPAISQILPPSLRKSL